jgi:hypothetical protein
MEYASLAQLVEQGTLNPKVAGSIPARRTKRERGRENGSFPEVEVLKPQGFKERSDMAAIVQW